MSCDVARDDVAILIVTDAGYGKRTQLDKFNRQGRGGQGVRGIKLTAKKGVVVAAFMVGLDDEIFVIASGGVVIRMAVRDISSQGRDATGVRVMNLDGDQTVAAVAPVLGEPTRTDADLLGPTGRPSSAARRPVHPDRRRRRLPPPVRRRRAPAPEEGRCPRVPPVHRSTASDRAPATRPSAWSDRGQATVLVALVLGLAVLVAGRASAGSARPRSTAARARTAADAAALAGGGRRRRRRRAGAGGHRRRRRNGAALTATGRRHRGRGQRAGRRCATRTLGPTASTRSSADGTARCAACRWPRPRGRCGRTRATAPIEQS